MTTTSTRKPRRRPSPSARDQQIYVEYSVSGKTQLELAADHKLTQCRISQIIRRVAAWRANLDPVGSSGATAGSSSSALSDTEQKRLNRWLEIERLTAVSREAFRHFHKEQRTIRATKTTITTTTGSPEEKKSVTETIRELPASVQWLKTVLRAVEQLARLETRPALPAPKPNEAAREQIMFDTLMTLRDQAETNGDVVATGEPWLMTEILLGAFLGDSPASSRADFDPALQQIAASLFPREGEAPAEPPQGPQTTASSPTSSTCASDADSSEPLSPEHLLPPSTSEKFSEPSTEYPVLPSPSLPFDSAHLARRLEHYRKLEQLKEFRRRGLPIMLEFDPEDGPLPPTYHQLDGAESDGGGYITTPGNY